MACHDAINPMLDSFGAVGKEYRDAVFSTREVYNHRYLEIYGIMEILLIE